MESINRLREYVENASRMSISLMARATLLGMVRDIEQEVGNMVPLPVDADGVPIHVGDVMDEQLPFGGYAAPAPVDTMELSRGAGGYVWMVRLDSESGAFINPKLLRHHHAPTVEDVLRELVRVMAYCMQQGRDCDGCAVNGADGVVTAPSGCDTLRDRMREMGVVE